MEAHVPADTVQSYLISTKYTKVGGVPKVLGLPRHTPSAASGVSGVDETLTFPPIRPRRNSSRRSASVASTATPTGKVGPGRGAGGVGSRHRHSSARGHGHGHGHSNVGYVGIDGRDDVTSPGTETGTGKTSRPYNSARVSRRLHRVGGNVTDAMPPIPSAALRVPHPPADDATSPLVAGGVPRLPRSARQHQHHGHGHGHGQGWAQRGRSDRGGGAGPAAAAAAGRPDDAPGNQLMDGVLDSAERAKVNALKTELGHLVHAADKRGEQLEELELDLEQMMALGEAYGYGGDGGGARRW